MKDVYRNKTQEVDITKREDGTYILWACEENAPTPSVVRFTLEDLRGLYKAIGDELRIIHDDLNRDLVR